MHKRISVIVVFVLSSISVLAQNFKELFSAYRQQAIEEYQVFRTQCNKEYADFVEKTWTQFKQQMPKILPLKDKPVPPQPYDKDDDDAKDKHIQYSDIIPVAPPIPQPTPIEPIIEQPQAEEEQFAFLFFGTKGKVRLSDRQRFKLNGVSEKSVADAWRALSDDKYNNVIRDCLKLRIKHGLCDWAYLQMLVELCNAFLGKYTNEATLMTAYLYCQSGYKMRLARGTNSRLYLMVSTRYSIYGEPYYHIDGEDFYPLDCREKTMYICNVTFPNEKPLSLYVSQELNLAESKGENRTLQSKQYPQLNVSLQINKNLITFFNTYPSSQLGDNFMTHWAMYANAPLAHGIKEELYPKLREAIQGKTQNEAANMLLNFVQTAFVYEYDEKVWGKDRAFFAEESLYYPYCDCEDRSILFSRLVRDLLGLKVVLVYYPGHLATAVQFADKVTGDFIVLNGSRFTVCDPTYIGAPVGATMPDMDNAGAKVILLD